MQPKNLSQADASTPAQLQQRLLTGILSIGAALLLSTALAVLDRGLGGWAMFPRLVEVLLDKLGLAQWLVLLPRDVLATLGWPEEASALVKFVAEQRGPQICVIAILFYAGIRKWWATPLLARQTAPVDREVVRPLPPVTGLLPWIATEDRVVEGAKQSLLQWLRGVDADAPRHPWWQTWRLRKPARPLHVMLLLGENGVGKSQLGWELALEIDGRSLNRGQRWDAGEWLPSANTGQTGIATGKPQIGDQSAFEPLKSWRPRRPTLLVFDEPGVGDAGRLIQALQNEAARFDHPVALLVVDQVIPAELLTQAPAVTRLVDVRFSVGDLRRVGSAFQRRRSAAQSFIPNLYEEEDLKRFIEVTLGEPLSVALGVHDLSAHPGMSVARWSTADPRAAEAALEQLAPDSLRHRLVAARASDLIDTIAGGNAEVAPRARLLDAMCAASLAGGLWLKGVMTQFPEFEDMDVERFGELFPAALTQGRMPAFGNLAVQDAALEQWVARSMNAASRADRIAKLAWAESPEAAARAALRRQRLPKILRDALFARISQAPMTLSLLLEHLRASMAGQLPIERTREAIERLAPADFAELWNGAIAITENPEWIAPLVRLELLARIARFRINQSPKDELEHAADDMLRELGRAQRAVGPFSDWLDDSAVAAAEAVTACIEALLTVLPLSRWRPDQVSSLQAELIDPQLGMPLSLESTRLIALLTREPVAAENENAFSWHALWLGLLGKESPDQAVMLTAWRSLGEEDAVLAPLRWGFGVWIPANRARYYEMWPHAVPVGSEDRTDLLPTLLASSAEAMPRLTSDARVRVLRWCSKALGERLPAFSRAGASGLAVIRRTTQSLLSQLAPSQAQALEPELDGLACAWGCLCVLWDAPSAVLDAAIPAPPTGGPENDARMQSLTAEYSAIAALKKIEALTPSGPSLEEAQALLLEMSRLRETDAARGMMNHCAVRATRLVVLGRLITALISATGDLSPYRKLIAPLIEAWLSPLRQQEPTQVPVILRCAFLDCLSEYGALLARSAVLQEVQLGVARDVATWADTLGPIPPWHVGLWRARAWYYAIMGCALAVTPSDGLAAIGQQPTVADKLLILARSVFRDELAHALEDDSEVARTEVGRTMRAMAAGHLITLACSLRDPAEAFSAARESFLKDLLPSASSLACLSHYWEAQNVIIVSVSNVLVAAKRTGPTPTVMREANELFKERIAPALELDKLPAGIAHAALKAWSTKFEIDLLDERISWLDRYNAALTSLGWIERRAQRWDAACRNGPTTGIVALTAAHLVQFRANMLLQNETQPGLDQLDELAALVEQWVAGPAARHAGPRDLWLDMAVAQSWRHCTFIAHHLRRADMTAAFFARFTDQLLGGSSPGTTDVHPYVVNELACTLNYHASTLCLTGSTADGVRLISTWLRHIAETRVHDPLIQFALAESISIALQTASDLDLNAVRELAQILRSALGRLPAALPPEGPDWTRLLANARRGLEMHQPAAAAEIWWEAGLPLADQVR